jgi:hypothetical protein
MMTTAVLPAERPPVASQSGTENPGLLRAAHTTNFPALLRRLYPDLINDNDKLLESSFVVPTECLDEVSAKVRAE